MNEIVPITERGEITGCDGRRLYDFLDPGRDYSTWITGRLREFGFEEGKDFVKYDGLIAPNPGTSKSRARKSVEYHLSLDTAKELAMVENSDKGREVRRYFIECEKRLRQVLSGGNSSSVMVPLDQVRQMIREDREHTVKLFADVMFQSRRRPPRIPKADPRQKEMDLGTPAEKKSDQSPKAKATPKVNPTPVQAAQLFLRFAVESIPEKDGGYESVVSVRDLMDQYQNWAANKGVKSVGKNDFEYYVAKLFPSVKCREAKGPRGKWPVYYNIHLKSLGGPDIEDETQNGQHA